MNIDDLLAEREKTHGSFSRHADATQALKQVMRRFYRPYHTAVQIEALEMIQHKIGRILAGDPTHADHWDDIAGYATLVTASKPREVPSAQKPIKKVDVQWPTLVQEPVEGVKPDTDFLRR